MGCFTSKLKECDKTTPFLSFEGKIIEAKVVDVYDGDTIKCVFEVFKGQYYQWNIRLHHIDTPELRSKNELEKKAGYIVKDFLSQLILGKIVKLRCGKFEKYGRLLADIEYKGQNINKLLVTKGYAYLYEGLKKSEWKDIDLKKIIN
jgi:micrococcal nuclease